MDSQASIVTETVADRPVVPNPVIIPRAQHGISRSRVSENALKVLYRLKDAGYQAYLVGGSVRDLLLDKTPKDFDVATDAHPEQVRNLFRNCRLIGRRFRLAHVHFGREIIEVATFRASGVASVTDEDLAFHENGRILRDNVYGTIQEDALRRDFTINALYYNIRDFSLVDYCGAMEDLKARVLRLVGDPRARYQEDPVRLLRAVRFATKLDLRIEPGSEQPLYDMGGLLEGVPAARLFEEVLKLFQGGNALKNFRMLKRYGLLSHLFPGVGAAEEAAGSFIERALANTDQRVQEDLPVTPAFLYAALLWQPLQALTQLRIAEDMNELQALHAASHEITAHQVRRTSIPKRFSVPMQEIWLMQPRFAQRSGKRTLRLLTHPRFRAAYDFYCLRASAGESPDLDADWWTRLIAASPEEQKEMTKGEAGEAGSGSGRRRSRSRKRRSANP